jgi:hypothetical protein
MCKEYQTKSFESGSQINHNFFSVPVSLVALPQFEMIEDIEISKSNSGYFDPERARAIYTETGFDSEDTKLEELKAIRDNHEKKSFKLLETFKEIICSGIEE